MTFVPFRKLLELSKIYKGNMQECQELIFDRMFNDFPVSLWRKMRQTNMAILGYYSRVKYYRMKYLPGDYVNLFVFFVREALMDGKTICVGPNILCCLQIDYFQETVP